MVSRMEKNTDKWHKIEAYLINQSVRQNFYQRDIWHCYLGKNIGDEENGSKNFDYTRPIIIIRKFNTNIFLCVPITKTAKDGEYYFKFSFIDSQDSYAIISQLNTLDAKRLISKIGYINKKDFRTLTERLKGMIP